MNSQDFLTINLVGAGAFLFWYLVSRGGSTRPTQLNMKAKDTTPTLLPEAPFPEAPVATTPAPFPFRTRKSVPLGERPVKSLNVMFNYNGHSWDAYEVLGVPAGASIKIVTDAYQAAIRRSTGTSLEFFETAYRAILNQQSGDSSNRSGT